MPAFTPFFSVLPASLIEASLAPLSSILLFYTILILVRHVCRCFVALYCVADSHNTPWVQSRWDNRWMVGCYLIRSIRLYILVVDLLCSGRQFASRGLLVVFAGHPEVHVLLAELQHQEACEDGTARWQETEKINVSDSCDNKPQWWGCLGVTHFIL